MTIRQTPDAVREAIREDIAKQLDEPWRDRVILRPEQWQIVLAALDSRAGDAGDRTALPPGWKSWTGGAFAPQDYGGRYMLRNGSLHEWRPGDSAGPSWKWEYGDGDVVAYFATPAPAVDAVPAGEAEPSLNRHDLYRFMDTLKLSEKRDVAKAIGFDPAPLPGENDMNRWRRMWLWAGENGKRSELATAIRAALSHGEGRK